MALKEATFFLHGLDVLLFVRSIESLSAKDHDTGLFNTRECVTYLCGVDREPGSSWKRLKGLQKRAGLTWQTGKLRSTAGGWGARTGSWGKLQGRAGKLPGRRRLPCGCRPPAWRALNRSATQCWHSVVILLSTADTAFLHAHNCLFANVPAHPSNKYHLEQISGSKIPDPVGCRRRHLHGWAAPMRARLPVSARRGGASRRRSPSTPASPWPVRSRLSISLKSYGCLRACGSATNGHTFLKMKPTDLSLLGDQERKWHAIALWIERQSMMSN